MLLGTRIALRARAATDVDVLDAELHDDVEVWSRVNPQGWRPRALGADSSFAPREPSAAVAEFSVVSRDDDALLGSAIVWGIDLHNRVAHLGLSLRPAARASGFGTEIVEVLCRYCFVVLGLHRVQLETLADNASMRSVAERCGFHLEGTTRSSSWVAGAWVDDVTYGLLVDEWRAGGER